MSLLPEGFEDLDLFCERWCLSGSNERQMVRATTSMDEIRVFYDSMLKRASDVLVYLDRIALGELNPAQGNLLKLVLSLAEIGPSVEWFDQPRVIDGYEEEKFPMTLEVPDLNAQI